MKIDQDQQNENDSKFEKKFQLLKLKNEEITASSNKKICNLQWSLTRSKQANNKLRAEIRREVNKKDKHK